MSVRTAVSHRLVSLAAVAALASLAGCSSKPGDSDIAHALEAAYSCPDLLISDVKKIDGVEGGGTYRMAFSFKLALKEDEAGLARRAADTVKVSKKGADQKALTEAFRTGSLFMERETQALAKLMSDSGKPTQPGELQWARDYQAAAEAVQRGGGGDVTGPAKACTSMMSMAWGWPSFYSSNEPVKVDDSGHVEIVREVQFKTTSNFVKADSGWLLASVPSTMDEAQVVKERVKVDATTAGAQANLPGGPWGAPKHPGVTKLPFPCETAYTKLQKMLCSSPVLAARDDEERTIYDLLMRSGSGQILDRSRDQGLEWRYRTLAACETEACALAAYDQHISAMRGIGANLQLPPSSSFAQGPSDAANVGSQAAPAVSSTALTSPTAAVAVAPQAPAPAAPTAPTASIRPSFDCAKASTKVETLICSEPALAQADASTTAAFKAALPAAAEQSAFRARHAEWRRKVRDACTDAPCIAAAYKARLAELGR
ncbi:hypothetical protein [Inhella sp.]|uniref:hypothetical protein n=1 Tax=Inhella sp. TaxID=1921806 RepID=UPI0035B37CBD